MGTVRQTPLLGDCEVAGGRLGGTRRGGRPKLRRQRPEFRKEPRMHQANQRPIQSADGSRAKRRYRTCVEMAFACRAQGTPKEAATQGITSFGFAGLDLPPPWAKNAPHMQANAISQTASAKISLDSAGLLMEAATKSGACKDLRGTQHSRLTAYFRNSPAPAPVSTPAPDANGSAPLRVGPAPARHGRG